MTLHVSVCTRHHNESMGSGTGDGGWVSRVGMYHGATDDVIKRYNDLYAAIEHCYFDEHPDADGCVKMVKMLKCARDATRAHSGCRMLLRDLREVIMPTTRFILRVKQVCKDRHMVTLLTDEHVHEIRQEVEERLRQFEAASLDAQSGQAAMQDMIRLSEDFVLLVALDQWSKA